MSLVFKFDKEQILRVIAKFCSEHVDGDSLVLKYDEDGGIEVFLNKENLEN